MNATTNMNLNMQMHTSLGGLLLAESSAARETLGWALAIGLLLLWATLASVRKGIV